MLSRQLSRTLSSPAFRRGCSPLQLAEGLKAGQATSCCPHASLKNTRSSFPVVLLLRGLLLQPLPLPAPPVLLS